MKKKSIKNAVSSIMIVFGGIFVFNILINNVNALTDTNVVNDWDYISGLQNQNVRDEVDGVFVGDKCIYSSTGYFDNKVQGGKQGVPLKDRAVERISCDSKVSGVSFDKDLNILTLNNYKGGESIRFIDNRKKDTQRDFKVYIKGENKAEEIDIAMASAKESGKSGRLEVVGGGKLVLEKSFNMFYAPVEIVSFKDVDIEGKYISANEIENSKLDVSEIYVYSGSGGSSEGSLNIKNSDVSGAGINHEHYGFNDIVIENSNINDGGYISGRTIKIKNSNLSLKASETVEWLKGYNLVYASSGPIKVAEADYDSLVESMADKITIEDGKLQDGLKIKNSVDAYWPTEHYGYYEVASVIGTDETVFNNENRRYDNVAKTVEIVANKPELVGADLKPVSIDGSEKDILEGESQIIDLGESKDLVIRYDRDIELFKKVVIDDMELDESFYTIKSGSTILAIKNSYLQMMGNGDHGIAAYFAGDEEPIKTNFTVKGGYEEEESGAKDDGAGKNVKSSNTGGGFLKDSDDSIVAISDNKMTSAIVAVSFIVLGFALRFKKSQKKYF